MATDELPQLEEEDIAETGVAHDAGAARFGHHAFVSILIPVLNEAANLRELARRVPKVLDDQGLRWEIIFVDDGSDDETMATIREMNGADPRYRAVSFSRNFGKEIAIAAGLRHVRGDAVIIMDADLQHPPDVVGSFIARWREGYDIVYGQRLDRRTDGPIYRFFARRFYKLYNMLVDSNIPEGAGDFRLLSRRAVDAMNRLTETSRFNKGLYNWIGFKSIGVPYSVAARRHGRSSWSPRKLVGFAMDGVTSFSTLPLRVWSLLGLAISLVAIFYSLYFFVLTMMSGTDRPGFPSLIISIMFFAGAQLISLGILGEYLGRVYEEVKARPLYIVADTIGVDTGQDPHANRCPICGRPNATANESDA